MSMFYESTIISKEGENEGGIWERQIKFCTQG